MATWVNTYDYTWNGASNVAAVAKGATTLTTDGYSVALSGAQVSVNSNQLSVASNVSLINNQGVYWPTNAAHVTRDGAMMCLISPGNLNTANGAKATFLRAATPNSTWGLGDYICCCLSGHGALGVSFNYFLAFNNDPYASSATALGFYTAQTSATFTATNAATNYYIVVLTWTGSFPATMSAALYDMGASPPAALSTLNPSAPGGTQVGTTFTLTDAYSNSAVNPHAQMGQEQFNAQACWGIGGADASNAHLYQEIAFFMNSDVQPAVPEIKANQLNAIQLAAFDQSGTGAGLWATGGSNSFQYYWHRSTSSGFTPSNGTRISGALASPVYTDTTALTPGTLVYYALETFDTVNTTSSYAYLGYVSSPTVGVFPYNSSLINIAGAGHSYISSQGASSSSQVLGTGTGLGPQGIYAVAQGVFTGTTYTARNTNTSVSGSWMRTWQAGRGYLRTGFQLALMGGADTVFCMLSTNDIGLYSNTGNKIQNYWSAFTKYYLSAPGMLGVIILVAPPTISNGSDGLTLTQAKTYAAGQLPLHNGRTVVVAGLAAMGLMQGFNTSANVGYNNATVWTAANELGNNLGSGDTAFNLVGIKAQPGGPMQQTDGLHPNDFGHLVYGMDLAQATLLIKNAQTFPSAAPHIIGA